MKFTDGYWKVKKDISLYQASQVNEIEYTDHTLTVYAAGAQTGEQKNLGGITLTVDFFSPKEDVIGVRISHYQGNAERKLGFVDAAQICGEVRITGEKAYFKSGKAEVRITLAEEWKVEFYYENRYLTRSAWRSAGYIRTEQAGNYMKEELQLGVDEYVYGFGEKFTAFIKNGQVVDIWNCDGGTSTEQAYKNIPFYITNRGYGVLVNDSGKVSFEVASEKVERVQFSAEGEQLEYYLIAGKAMPEVLMTYNELLGKPALPPAWSFGLWLTTSFTTDYDEKTANHFIEGMKDRKIPLEVFHFDCFWMKGSHWCNFDWDEKAFPNPEEMIRKLKAKGLKICVWINSYIAQRSRLFKEGKEKGYFIKKMDGSIWQTDEWQPGMAIVDFTNREACKWYQAELRHLLHMGVDTFKTDFGERIPHEGVVYHDGSDPKKMHNYYTQLYNKTVFDLLEEELGEGNAMVFARSATAGGQKFPVHWGGDCVASYESMSESLRGGLSLTACGFGFWSHDMGGFENCATPDLYKRWVAFGMLSTHSRLHGNSSYRVPWLFDEEAVEVLRYFTNLKCSLMPYLYSMAVKTHKTGIPMMQAMVMSFDKDRTVPYLDKQYMLGDSILVAPVFREEGDVSYYLPEGKWTNLLTNEKKDSGWQEENFDYFGLPVMVRENSIIPMGEIDSRTVYDYTQGVIFHVFELKDKASVEVFQNDGSYCSTMTAKREGNSFKFYALGFTDWSVCIRNCKQVSAVCGGSGKAVKEGYLIKPDSNDCEIIVTC